MPDSNFFHQSTSQAAVRMARIAAAAKAGMTPAEYEKKVGSKHGSPASPGRSLEQPNKSKAQNRYAKQKTKNPY